MTYRRVEITAFGGPEVLRVVEQSVLPEPEAGEVRVRMLATGANFTDVMIRKGMYPDVKEKPPFVPGYDMVGVVDALGDGTSRFAPGQIVADLTVLGAYSEYLCLPEAHLTPVPDGLDPAMAVALVLSYLTAYQLLYRVAAVQSGQRIMVHGAGGAVGSALLQLGKLLGLKMYGTASPAKHDAVRRLGAVPLDYRDKHYPARILAETGGVDVVFDGIGGESFKRSFRMLNKGGKLVAYGFYDTVLGRSGSIPLDFLRLQLWRLLPNGRLTVFYSIAPWRAKHPDWYTADLTTLFDLLRQGKIKPLIGKRLPLVEAAQAHALVERAAVAGKIVLLPEMQS
jgi:NADPH:quinone reductase-like Zn-dependent oxidoreductase